MTVAEHYQKQMKQYGAATISFYIIQEAIDWLTHHASLGPNLQGKWLSAKTFVEAMKTAKFFSDEHATIIDVEKVISAMAKSKKMGYCHVLFWWNEHNKCLLHIL